MINLFMGGFLLIMGVVAFSPDNANAASSSVPSDDHLSSPKDLIRLKSLLSNWQTLQGRFVQKIYDENDELLESSKGKWYLKKPKLFRWETEGRDRLLIVTDGKEIWHYDPDLSQVVVEKFDPSSASPLLLLTGQIDGLEKRYQINDIVGKYSICAKYESDCYELIPSQKGSGHFQWMRMGFAQGKLSEIEFLDALGQRGWIEFQNVTVDKPIEASLFTFKAPKGVDVVKRSGEN